MPQSSTICLVVLLSEQELADRELSESSLAANRTVLPGRSLGAGSTLLEPSEALPPRAALLFMWRSYAASNSPVETEDLSPSSAEPTRRLWSEYTFVLWPCSSKFLPLFFSSSLVSSDSSSSSALAPSIDKLSWLASFLAFLFIYFCNCFRFFFLYILRSTLSIGLTKSSSSPSVSGLPAILVSLSKHLVYSSMSFLK